MLSFGPWIFVSILRIVSRMGFIAGKPSWAHNSYVSNIFAAHIALSIPLGICVQIPVTSGTIHQMITIVCHYSRFLHITYWAQPNIETIGLTNVLGVQEQQIVFHLRLHQSVTWTLDCLRALV